ncbi:hypothetical protein ES703_56696 [subsurface metagenome]
MIPNITVGIASPMNEPRHPQAAAMAAAMSGARKKLPLPPIKWNPSARPRFFGSTDAEIIGAADGW